MGCGMGPRGANLHPIVDSRCLGRDEIHATGGVMGWARFHNSKNQTWSINKDGLWLLAKAYCTADLILKNASYKLEKAEIGPFLSVDVKSVEINWNNVHQSARQSAVSFCRSAYFNKDVISMNTVEYLASVRKSTTGMNSKLTSMLRSASDETGAAFKRMDDRLATFIKWVRIARDADLQLFLVVGGLASGGTAWAALGGGSVAAGVFKYQDTHHLDSAVVSAAGTFVVGAIPIAGAGLRDTVKVLGAAVPKQVVIISASAGATAGSDAASSFVEGKSASAGVKGALVDAGLSVLVGGVNIKLEKFALPIKATLETAIAEGQQKFVEFVSDDSPPSPALTRPTPQAIACPHNPIASRIPLDDRSYILRNVLQPIG
jgi:hypothetical protein